MRTFGLTVHGTVTAATEEDALDLVEQLLPGGLGSDIAFEESEVTDQVCAECWGYTDADSQRCEECRSQADPAAASGA
jgi:hypothetical protein